MTPKPPTSPDGSPLPPRHRPSLGNLAQDTTEMDLWAFEDDLDDEPAPQEPQTGESARPGGANREIPQPRDKPAEKKKDGGERSTPKTPTGGEDRIRMNINKARTKNRPAGSSTSQTKPESDFDDLENWEDAQKEPEIEDLPSDAGIVPILEPAEEPMARTRDEPAIVEVPQPSEPTQPAVAPESDDEFSPVKRENAQPVSLRPHLGLSKVERIGLVSLLVVLLGGAVAVIAISMNRLPTETVKAGANDFPIKGSHLEVDSAVSYWRPPITDGPDADTFRRDTQLLPVIELDVKGGPGAIRVLFRNEERTVVGDAVTRSVHDDGVIKIAATAGFDDLGMHAAYRTGESKPWTIEVYEALSEDAVGKDFRRLFEMNISTDRR
jgi:hypothetical protein